MSEGKPRPPKAVISRRVLLAAGGLVVLGEFIAGEGSGGANDTRASASGTGASHLQPERRNPGPHTWPTSPAGSTPRTAATAGVPGEAVDVGGRRQFVGTGTGPV